MAEAFYHAIAGVICAFRNERILRVHIAGSLIGVAAGVYFEFAAIRWSLTIMAIAVLLVTELMNTAVERLTDMAVGSRYHQLAREAKDVAAGAVFCFVISLAMLACVMFASTPKGQALLSHCKVTGSIQAPAHSINPSTLSSVNKLPAMNEER